MSKDFFVIGQNIWRKIQEEGLVGQFTGDENFRAYCKMLLALSFVAPDDVHASFEELADNAPEALTHLF